MKKILLAVFSLISIISYSQTTGYLRYDSVKVMKQNGNSTLIIENATRNVTNGFLQNYSEGRTRFARALDSVWIDGDSIRFRYGTATLAVAAPGGDVTQSALDDTAAAIRGDFPPTPGIDDVLAVGQSLTANRSIDMQGNDFSISHFNGGLDNLYNALAFQSGQVQLSSEDDNNTSSIAMIPNQMVITSPQLKINGIPRLSQLHTLYYDSITKDVTYAPAPSGSGSGTDDESFHELTQLDDSTWTLDRPNATKDTLRISRPNVILDTLGDGVTPLVTWNNILYARNISILGGTIDTLPDGGIQIVVDGGGDTNPDIDNTYDLGSSALAWKDAYAYTFKLKSTLGGLTTLQSTNSASNFTITYPAVTGTVVLREGNEIITGDKVFNGANTYGTMRTGSTSATANFFASTGSAAVNMGSTAALQLEGSTNASLRALFGAGTAYLAVANNTVGNVTMVGGGVTEPSSGNVPLIHTLALTGPVVTNAAGTSGKISTLYIKNEASGVTPTGRANGTSIWVESGETYLKAGLGLAITSTSSDITLDATHYTVKVDATGAARTITLPAAAGCTGRIYVIKKTDGGANAVTVDANASETIDGSTTFALATQYKYVSIQSDGTNWMVTANN